MARLNVDYDLLTWEGDILRLHFWATAFDDLKTRRRRVPADRRPPEGLLGHADRGRPRRRADADADDDGGDEEQREKVIVRSNGTVTYVGKDIANQFWKFGLLGTDFHYRVFERARRPPALGDDVEARRRRRACRRSAARRPCTT